MRSLLLVVALAGCYSGARASRGVNEAWRGRSRAELEARWGPPAMTEHGATTLLVWTHDRRHVELEGATAKVRVDSRGGDAALSWRSRLIETRTEVIAEVDGGTVVDVRGPSLRWGPPRGANLRWGTVLGMHVGMGALDDTATPLPSGGLYLGGMLGPRLGLVGTFALASGSDDDGGAIGLAAGIGAQWWPLARVWLRAGPALVLDWDPGFEDATLGPGLAAGASVAVIRAGAFVLDLRLDAIAAPGVAFGSVGVGVNLN